MNPLNVIKGLSPTSAVHTTPSLCLVLVPSPGILPFY